MHHSVKSSNKLPTALIVGVAGFVGSHFAENLIAQNVKVIGIDSLVSGNEHYLEKLKKSKDFTYIEHDITLGLPTDLPSLKYIIHVGGIEEYLSNFDITIEILKVNAQGTTCLLDYVKDNPDTKFMLGSTHNVYAGILSSLSLEHYFGISERDSKRFAHHEAKRFAEALTAQYYRKYNIDARIIRVAHIYGPRMSLKAATDLSHLIKRAIYDDTLTICGDGLKKLRPTFISDVISGMSKALFYPESTGKIYNLVNEQEMTVLECAYAIQRNCAKPLTLQFLPRTEELMFPSHKIELLQTQSELGWKPKVSFDRGITETLEYMFLEQKKTQYQATEEIANEKNLPKETKTTVILPHINEKLSEKNNDHTTFKTIKWTKIAHLVVVGASVFTILTIGIFPIAAFYYYTENATVAIRKENTDSQQYVNNLLQANNQLAHVEWFYTITQQREQLENTRELINTLIQVQDQSTETERHKRKTLQLYSFALKKQLNYEEMVSNQDKIQLNIQELEYAQNYIAAINKSLLTPDNMKLIQGYTQKLKKQQDVLIDLYSQFKRVFQVLSAKKTEKGIMLIYLNSQKIGMADIKRSTSGIQIGTAIANTEIYDDTLSKLYVDQEIYDLLAKVLNLNIYDYSTTEEYISNWNKIINSLQNRSSIFSTQTLFENITNMIEDENIALYSPGDRCSANLIKNEDIQNPGLCLKIEIANDQKKIPQQIQIDLSKTTSKTNLKVTMKESNAGTITLTLPSVVNILNYQQQFIKQMDIIKSEKVNNKVVYTIEYDSSTSNENIVILEWEEPDFTTIPIQVITLPFGVKPDRISYTDGIKTHTTKSSRLVIPLYQEK